MFRRLVCEHLPSGTSSPKMLTGCLRKKFTGVNNSRQRVRDNFSSGTNSLVKATVYLIKKLKWNDFP